MAATGDAHLSTGDLLRSAVADGTPLGVQARKFMDAGELVPDDVVIGMIRERLEAGPSEGFLLDGFPRSVPQAEALDRLLGALDAPLNLVLVLEVGRDELLSRLLARGRDDDTPETVAKRLDVYLEQTEPLIGYYEARGLVARINGEQSVDEVFGEIEAAVQEAG